MGFIAWLTTRDEPLTMSARHNVGPAMDAYKEFCERYGLQGIRDDKWPHCLKAPHPLVQLARCAE